MQNRAAKNPAASTLAFQHHRLNWQTNLLGLAASRKVDRPVRAGTKGICGRPVGYNDVIEQTGRGCHHGHESLHAGLAPGLLADVAQDDAPVFVPALGREMALRELAAEALDTQMESSVPLAYHVAAVAQRALKVAKRRDAAVAVPDPERLAGFLPEHRAPFEDLPEPELRRCLAAALTSPLLTSWVRAVHEAATEKDATADRILDWENNPDRAQDRERLVRDRDRAAERPKKLWAIQERVATVHKNERPSRRPGRTPSPAFEAARPSTPRGDRVDAAKRSRRQREDRAVTRLARGRRARAPGID